MNARTLAASAIGRRREQHVQADGQQAAALHLLQQTILIEADTGMADAGESGGVELVVLRGPVSICCSRVNLVAEG